MIEQEKSNTHKNIFTHLLNSQNLTVKFVLLGILSCTIFVIPCDRTFSINDHTASAHFFGGETVTIDDYQVVFLTAPSSPAIGDNSTTLNFSVLQNNSNIYNIQSAVVITEKNSGRIVEQIPYRVYEFSDITLPYTFQNTTDYTITLQTRITGDEKYQATPLVASFDITVADPSSLIPFNELMLFYVTPVTLVITGIMIYLHMKGKF